MLWRDGDTKVIKRGWTSHDVLTVVVDRIHGTFNMYVNRAPLFRHFQEYAPLVNRNKNTVRIGCYVVPFWCLFCCLVGLDRYGDFDVSIGHGQITLGIATDGLTPRFDFSLLVLTSGTR